jgi:hypothetical protein
MRHEPPGRHPERWYPGLTRASDHFCPAFPRSAIGEAQELARAEVLRKLLVSAAAPEVRRNTGFQASEESVKPTAAHLQMFCKASGFLDKRERTSQNKASAPIV